MTSSIAAPGKAALPKPFGLFRCGFLYARINNAMMKRLSANKKKAEPPPTAPVARVWTSLDLIKWTTEYFARKGIESGRREAELMLSDVLGCPRIKLYTDFEKPVPAEKLNRFREFVKRRGETREPLQYILGHTDFIDIPIKVSPATLIPRPETEELATWAIERLKAEAAPKPEEASPAPTLNVLDLCTGTGCLALYIAKHEPRAKVTATDIAPQAVALARENAAALKLAERVEFREGDLFAALSPESRQSFDLIAANPPYVDPAMRETLMPEVRDHEPASALFAEDSGLAVSRRIIAEAHKWLKPGGWLGMEFGIDQAEVLKKLAGEAGKYSSVEIKPDAAKIPRMLVVQRSSDC